MSIFSGLDHLDTYCILISSSKNIEDAKSIVKTKCLFLSSRPP